MVNETVQLNDSDRVRHGVLNGLTNTQSVVKNFETVRPARPERVCECMLNCEIEASRSACVKRLHLPNWNVSLSVSDTVRLANCCTQRSNCLMCGNLEVVFPGDRNTLTDSTKVSQTVELAE